MKRCSVASAVVLLAVLLTAACEKPKQIQNEDEQGQKPAPGQLASKSNELNVYDWKNWIYFSFRTNGVVKVTDASQDMGWDVGFHLTDIRTNGGESGKGKGAAVATNLEALSADIKLDGLKWVTDRTGVGIKKEMMAPEDKSVSINESLSNRIVELDLNVMPPKVKVSKKVWLIKDAEGKVVAFRVVSCEAGKSSGKYQMPLKFEFAYLPEGK